MPIGMLLMWQVVLCGMDKMIRAMASARAPNTSAAKAVSQL